jgi:putative membrane protein
MKPETLQDPRVFFAAERTLLAWMRTGLTVIVVGFVVARFGLFLRLLSLERAAAQPPAGSGFSAALGVLFVLAGSIAIVVATLQHRRFVATLPATDLPPSYSRRFAVAASAAVGALGLLLAGYLIATAA